MNYQKIHNCIIANAKLRILNSNVKYEVHHIVPRSMGGTDDPANLVSLTLQEHFVIHTLLWKIHRNRSMTAALWIMAKNKRYRYKEMNGRRYAELREAFRKNQTDQQVYKFENIYTGEEFTGTRKQFDKQYFNRSFEVVNNIRLANGWKLKGAIPKRISKNKIAQAQSLTNKGIK